jgi:hypothetical protein
VKAIRGEDGIMHAAPPGFQTAVPAPGKNPDASTPVHAPAGRTILPIMLAR